MLQRYSNNPSFCKVKIAASENFALAETFLHSLRVVAPQNLLIYAFSTSTTTDPIGKNNTAELTFRCLGG